MTFGDEGGHTGQASILVFCYICNTEGNMSHEEQTDLPVGIFPSEREEA